MFRGGDKNWGLAFFPAGGGGEEAPDLCLRGGGGQLGGLGPGARSPGMAVSSSGCHKNPPLSGIRKEWGSP